MTKDDKPTIEFQVDIVIEPDAGGFHAYCPALKGLPPCGETEQEALANAKDTAIAYLHSLLTHGDPIPVGIIVEKEKAKRATPPRKTPRHYREALTVAAA